MTSVGASESVEVILTETNFTEFTKMVGLAVIHRKGKSLLEELG